MWRRAILRRWPWRTRRWRAASLLHMGSLQGREALTDEAILSRMPIGESVDCAHDVRVRLERDAMCIGPFLFGDYEPAVSDAYARLVRSGRLVFDIGANFGWYSVLFAKKGCRVVAFEPVPPIATRLVDTLELNGVSVDVRRHAIGAENGEFTVHTFAGLPHGHASMLTLGRTDATPHRCAVRTLDSVVDELGTVPHFIKIDVEGAEPDVFAGGRGVLGSTGAPILGFEVNFETLAARGMSPQDLGTIVEELGYDRLWRIGERGPHRLDHVGDGHGDYVAAKSAHGDIWADR